MGLEIKTNSMLSIAEQLDKLLFALINQRLSVTWLDPLMLMLREPLTWLPLYLGVLIWSFKKMPTQVWWFLVLGAATFAITDFSSASLLKPWLQRVRPCYDESLTGVVRSLVGCGGRYSMPSSHAANHFGLAMFWFCCVFRVTGKRWHWVWVWAFMIGYAQVYVGKHFPADIIIGAVLGLLAGWLTFRIFDMVITGYNKRQSTLAA